MIVVRSIATDKPLASFELKADGEIESVYVSNALQRDVERGLLFKGKRLTPADGKAFLDALSATYKRSTTMWVDSIDDDPKPSRKDEWNEEDHPRAEDGRFGEVAGSGSGKKESSAKPTGTYKGTMYKTATEFPRTHLPKGLTKKEYSEDEKTSTRIRELLDKSYKARVQNPPTGEKLTQEESDELTRLSQESRAKEEEWESAIEKQVALGRIDPKAAEEAGWHGDGHAEKWIPLPEKMWHVTTAADKVLKDGLKTRDELNQRDGKGLGGGPASTISYTDNKNIAKAIQNSMLEFHDLLNDKVTIKELYDQASQGTGAEKPWGAELLRSMEGKSIDDLMSDKTRKVQWGKGPPRDEWYDPEAPRKSGLTGEILPDVKGSRVPIPEGTWKKVGETILPGGSEPHETTWERDKTAYEKDQDKARFYKAFSLWREHAGGQLDPLFFSTDVTGFKAAPRDQIKILEATPRTKDEDGEPIKPQGYRVSSLGEIRSHSGANVDVREFKDDDRKDAEWNEEDHPRAEDGKFGEVAGGGGGSGGGTDKSTSTAKTPAPPTNSTPTGNKKWRVTRAKAQEVAHEGLTALAAKPGSFLAARLYNDRAVWLRGLSPNHYDQEEGPTGHKVPKVRVDRRLTRVSGTHNTETGEIVLSDRASKGLQAVAERWAKNPAETRDMHRILPKMLVSEDIVAREFAEKQADDLLGAHTLVHETVHGFGPIRLEEKSGSALVIEEVSTEVIARAMVKEDLGYDLDDAWAARPDRVLVGYQRHIHATVEALSTTYNLDKFEARTLLEDASIAFKQIPQGRYGFSPLDLFARTIDAVYDGGADEPELKPSARATALNEALQRKWSQWL